MKILIVEDDPFKAKLIRDEILIGNVGASIEYAASLEEAIRVLNYNRYDSIILDMAIPSHSNEGGSTDVYSQPIGGLDVLLYLAFDERMERVIVLTQYPTVEFNREHVPIGKLKARLEKEGVMNLTAISLFGEDGKWRSAMNHFFGNNS